MLCKYSTDCTTLLYYTSALAVYTWTSYLGSLLVALKLVQNPIVVQFDLPKLDLPSHHRTDNAYIISLIKFSRYFHHLTTIILEE